MKKKFTSSGRCLHKCFGLPLATVLQQEYESGCASPEDVPLIVQRICDYIVRHGLLFEGIFRINGNSKTIENLRQQFEHHEHFDSSVQPQRDIFAMADLLKLFLRELPGGIVSEERTVQFLKASELIPTNESRRRMSNEEHIRALTLAMDEIRELIAGLPMEEYNLLKYLIRFLSIVTEQEAVNKMSPTSLGIVFGPNIFRCGLDFQALRNQGSTNRLIAFFIEHYDELFNVETPSYSPYHADNKPFFNAGENPNVPAILRNAPVTSGGGLQHSLATTSSLYRRASGPVGIEASYDRRGPSLSSIGRKSLMNEGGQELDHPSEVSNDDTDDQFKTITSESAVTSGLRNSGRDSKSGIVIPTASVESGSSGKRRASTGENSHSTSAASRGGEDLVPSARPRRTAGGGVSGTTNMNNAEPTTCDIARFHASSLDDDESELVSASSYPPDGADADHSDMLLTGNSTINNASSAPSPRLNNELSQQLTQLIRSVIDEQCPIVNSTPSMAITTPQSITPWPPLIPSSMVTPLRLRDTADNVGDVLMESTSADSKVHKRGATDTTDLRPSRNSATRSSTATESNQDRWENVKPPDLRTTSQVQKQSERHESNVDRQSMSNESQSQSKGWLCNPGPSQSSVEKRAMSQSQQTPPSQLASSSHNKPYSSSQPYGTDSAPRGQHLQQSTPLSSKVPRSETSSEERSSLPHRSGVQEAWGASPLVTAATPPVGVEPPSDVVNTPVEQIYDTLMLRLREKRRLGNRPEQLDQMSLEEVQDEKLEIQKCLLHYENLHGRPKTAHEKAVMKPLYDRYRAVKRAIARRSTSQGQSSSNASGLAAATTATATAAVGPYEVDSADEAAFGSVGHRKRSGASTGSNPPPLVNTTSRPSSGTPSKAPLGGSSMPSSSAASSSSRQTFVYHMQSPAVPNATPTTSSTPEHRQGAPSHTSSASRHPPYESMDLQELLREESALKEDKVHLQRQLKEFEYRFLEANGRRVDHEDKLPMRAEYNQYKQLKQRLRLLESSIRHRRECDN